MKNQIFKTILIIFAFVSFFNTAYATLNIDTTVDVPVSCSVTDTDGAVHNYPQADSYLAICALEKALEQNIVSAIDFVDFGFGLFINSVNNISQNNTYWQLRLNNVSASVGVSDLTLQAGDIVSLILTAFDPITFAETSLEDQVILHINSLIAPPLINSGGGPLFVESNPVTASPSVNSTISAPETKPAFDIEKAFKFITSQQKENGSFGEDLYTDWTAMALASGNYQEQTIKLVKYFGESKIENPLLTDYERRAMALMALGLNPYNTNGENYIEKIVNSFDGKQFGNANEDNDDIFALIVLQNAGYGQGEKMINDDISFVLSRQRENGSWDESVDMTGAAIEALANFNQKIDPLLTSPLAGGEVISNALMKAREFLKQNQKDNGGWNNASSTAWALEGILALNEKPEDWTKNDLAKDGASNTPLDYLATIQDTDGGIKNENLNNKIWETAYVASILSDKTWNQIMQKFEKPVVTEIQQESIQKEETKTMVVKKSPIAKVNNPNDNKIKLENIAGQNTAIALSATQNTETPALAQPVKKNWFMKLLDSIFGF
ncbi:hypothetical protein A3D43_02095 [Candidatus Nomurabacteria bacterium RIFCSPHIGHO2_02_FULL_41_52]|uniref:Transcobalamin-like C-terminal domain-containing protein n=2 Tax=Candidatus Nomuraibacteriota TaxID=1752729 RepID=A0A1F6YC20_9BACT|nr:MAG: hypothetical protein A3D43_02095 [Candidatus Nomurabacteria bacterium RIFCSPHIGHO2_02_FULL_41_52]OGI85321.1 MAG: hypothetical protein A3F49_01315 [Candidatus Nomurabacteria bacterium RIFCSPHIGHO2_12_FULL_42_19]OGJ03912.1 MAG: hypothetical protein A3F97_01625 [Candidatus Nomurabacteria bacterium RIFCSPLOWO2_12_FULL_41_10]